MTEEGETALHLAAGSNAADAIGALLEREADSAARNEEWATPLHVAARYGHLASMVILLEHGADVNATDREGATALHAAAWLYSDSVEVLMDHGADIHARDNDGRTPLHEAAASGSLDVLEILVQHGAEVDVEDDWGYTPLFDAVDAVGRGYGVVETVGRISCECPEEESRWLYGTTQSGGVRELRGRRVAFGSRRGYLCERPPRRHTFAQGRGSRPARNGAGSFGQRRESGTPRMEVERHRCIAPRGTTRMVRPRPRRCWWIAGPM